MKKINKFLKSIKFTDFLIFKIRLKEDPESTLIKFNPKDPESYRHYAQVMDKYFERYDNVNKTRDCVGTASNTDIIKDGKLTNADQEACRFSLKPFQQAGCLKSNDYGFKVGQPCVIVSLNRLIGWKPEEYDGKVPDEIAKRYKKGNIAFSCGGQVSIRLEDFY
jgi:sodium/potassium-transporting ATPase subunit beta